MYKSLGMSNDKLEIYIEEEKNKMESIKKVHNNKDAKLFSKNIIIDDIIQLVDKVDVDFSRNCIVISFSIDI